MILGTFLIIFILNLVKWKEYTKSEVKKYTEFLKVLRDAGASKVVHCSVINKYDMDTVYITEKEDLAKLGKEIQLDIDFWENLEI